MFSKKSSTNGFVLGTATLFLAASFGHAQSTLDPAKAPTIVSPGISKPMVPSISRPSAITPSSQPATESARVSSLPVAIPLYDHTAYKSAIDSGRAVILVFEKKGDAICEQQSAVLQSILQESEFSLLASFRIEVENAELSEKFGVKTAGTLLVMKAGVERLRSTGMVKSEAIRRMLRLTAAL